MCFHFRFVDRISTFAAAEIIVVITTNLVAYSAAPSETELVGMCRFVRAFVSLALLRIPKLNYDKS